jgi:hypothetical protein
MTPNTDRSRWFDFRLDVAAAIVGLLVALAMVPLRFLADQVYIETIPIVLALACVLYLLSVRIDGGTEFPTLSPGLTRLLPSVVFLGMAALVVIAVHQSRSSLFYYVAVWTGIAILIQVLFADERDYHVGLLLTQVVIFGAVVRLTGAFTAPGYVGIDVWTHVGSWTPAIAEAHSLAPIAAEKYYASPLFHLLVAVASDMLDVSIRHALLLTVGVAMPLTTILVYGTADVLVETRWAVFAAAAYAMSGNVIEWGIHLIPTSLGLVFYIAILWALTRIMATAYRRRDFFLVAFFSVAVILTHQISSFIMLVFVGGGLVAKALLSTGLLRPVRPTGLGEHVRETTNLGGLVVFDLGLITFMWSLTPYKGSTFLETVFSYFVEALRTSAGFLNLASRGSQGGGESAALPDPTLLEELVRYVDAAGLLLLLLGAVAGSLYVLHRERTSQATVTKIVAVVVMLLFVFGFPLFGIRTFVPGRWLAFLTVPLVVIGAIGIGYLARESPRTVATAVLLLFAVAYPAATLISSQGTLDSPAFDGVQTRYSYTESELAAIGTLADTTDTAEVPGEQIATDHPYGTAFERGWNVSAEVAVIDAGTSPNGTIAYREYATTGGQYYVNGAGIPYQPTVTQAEVCQGYGINYDSGDVAVCEEGIGN